MYITPLEIMNKLKHAGLTALLLAGGLTGAFAQSDDRNFRVAKNLDILNAAFKELDMFYVDSVDVDKVITTGIQSMLGGMDPYTEYYPEDDSTLKQMTTGKFGGIGSIIRYYTPRRRVAIIEPSEGSPAAEAGLQAGDIILEVNGKDMAQEGRTPNELTSYVSDNLRGDAGTMCVVKVDRPTGDSTYVTREFRITRGTIQTKPVPYYGMLPGQVGYIYISTFSIDNCSKDIKRALIELKQQGARRLVIDLRSNGGGQLGEAVNTVNLFVPKGLGICVTKGRADSRTYRTESEPIDPAIPLAVLVDGATASASEIVSGSLQDLDRAVIVGSRTYGKGLVQTIRELPYNSSMKVTTSKYYIPSGRCIQAIDYSKRNADGSVARTPDSLTTVYHTLAGREVRDGGGIRPDVEVEAEKMPNILFYLENDEVIFDYATRYVLTHERPEAVSTLQLTDADYADFKAFCQRRGFTYDRQSERTLKALKETAEFEGYLDDAKAEFEALEQKLTHNLDRELDRFQAEIKDAIQQELVVRYFYQSGLAQYRTQDDPDLKRALEVLNDEAEYRHILGKGE